MSRRRFHYFRSAPSELNWAVLCTRSRGIQHSNYTAGCHPRLSAGKHALLICMLLDLRATLEMQTQIGPVISGDVQLKASRPHFPTASSD